MPPLNPLNTLKTHKILGCRLIKVNIAKIRIFWHIVSMKMNETEK